MHSEVISDSKITLNFAPDPRPALGHNQPIAKQFILGKVWKSLDKH